MTPLSEYELRLEYLNLKLKERSKIWCILWRPEIIAGIDKYTAKKNIGKQL